MKLAYAVVTVQEGDVVGVSIFDSPDKAIAHMLAIYDECIDHDDSREDAIENNGFGCDDMEYTCRIWERPLNNEGEIA